MGMIRILFLAIVLVEMILMMALITHGQLLWTLLMERMCRQQTLWRSTANGQETANVKRKELQRLGEEMQVSNLKQESKANWTIQTNRQKVGDDRLAKRNIDTTSLRVK